MDAVLDAAARRRANDPAPVVHLELHSGDRARAAAFYDRRLSWQTELIDARSGSYHALGLGGGLDGGIVECGLACARWLPYVEVGEIWSATDRGRRLGATVLLEPREGPAGWRSVLACRDAGEIALWQPKRQTAGVR
jgi:predicted enzyme related to lactoylglutathione lyase